MKMMRCPKCNNKLGHIFFSHCFLEHGDHFCFDFFIVMCWWCGYRHKRIIYYPKMTEYDKESEAKEWMTKTIDLRKIGFTEKDIDENIL